MKTPCLDHDHYDGKCRGVVGSKINLFEGGVQKLWSRHMEENTSLTMSEVLRRLADYLERDYSNNKFHGAIVADLKKGINRWTKETIARNGMRNFGVSISEDQDKGNMMVEYLKEFTRRLERDYLHEGADYE